MQHDEVKLTDTQRLYLQTICDYFCLHGEWPTHKQLDLTLIKAGLDAEEVAKSLPSELFDGPSHFSWEPDDLAKLTVPVLVHCQGVEQELAAFVRVIEMCVERFYTEDRRLTSEEVRSQLHLSDLELQIVRQLLLVEPSYLYSSLGSDGHTWSLEVGSGVKGFRGIQTVQQYLDKRWRWRPTSPQIQGNIAPEQPSDVLSQREVFVVHGHDEGAREAVARFLEHLGLQPIILQEQVNAGLTVLEKFERYATVAYAIVLLTPDDVGASHANPDVLTPRARQNVILELGYFVGKLGRGKVCPLYKAGVELPSDLHGLVYIPMDVGGGWKTRLIKEIEAAGLPIQQQ